MSCVEAYPNSPAASGDVSPRITPPVATVSATRVEVTEGNVIVASSALASFSVVVLVGVEVVRSIFAFPVWSVVTPTNCAAESSMTTERLFEHTMFVPSDFNRYPDVQTAVGSVYAEADHAGEDDPIMNFPCATVRPAMVVRSASSTPPLVPDSDTANAGVAIRRTIIIIANIFFMASSLSCIVETVERDRSRCRYVNINPRVKGTFLLGELNGRCPVRGRGRHGPGAKQLCPACRRVVIDVQGHGICPVRVYENAPQVPRTRRTEDVGRVPDCPLAPCRRRHEHDDNQTD